MTFAPPEKKPEQKSLKENFKSLPTKAALVQRRIETLAGFSDSDKKLSRQFGTPAFINAGRKIKEYMIQAGLETHVDSVGNVRGRIPSSNPDAKLLVVGSHFDTIENSGKYNGALGVLIAIEAATSLVRQKISFPYHVEVIAFSEGEGVRFHSAHFGSKALVGTFDEELVFLEDDKGVTLSELLTQLNSSYDKITQSVIPKEKWLGFLDIHIEPGEQLNTLNTPVGIAEKIYGHKRIDIRFRGEAAHTGSLTMDKRRDALAAAAKFVLKVEDFALKDRNNILATIGRMKVQNAATNVIPSLVTCSLDMRSMDERKLDEAYESLHTICEKICHKRGIYFEWKLLEETPPVVCDPVFSGYLSAAIENAELTPVSVTSGLATEATIICEVAPVTMLFVRDSNGVSYNPDEKVLTRDIQHAIDVTEGFIKNVRP